MNLVFLTQQVFLRICDRLTRHGLATSKAAVRANGDLQASSAIATKTIADYTHATRPQSNFSLKPAAKPLRVVRVAETGLTRSSVGRMVISGRMADVCAELDRLAACEAAMT
jgi:hypothetical protein